MRSRLVLLLALALLPRTALAQTKAAAADRLASPATQGRVEDLPAERADRKAHDPYGLSAGAWTLPAETERALAAWGIGHASARFEEGTTISDAPALRARAMLVRAKALEESAAVDDRTAAELGARLPSLRLAAQAARDRAARAAKRERESLDAQVEAAEADVIVSEAEVDLRRRTAVDSRRAAHELRLLAVRIARPVATEEPDAGPPCEPPSQLEDRRRHSIDCW